MMLNVPEIMPTAGAVRGEPLEGYIFGGRSVHISRWRYYRLRRRLDWVESNWIYAILAAAYPGDGSSWTRNVVAPQLEPNCGVDNKHLCEALLRLEAMGVVEQDAARALRINWEVFNDLRPPQSEGVRA